MKQINLAGIATGFILYAISITSCSKDNMQETSLIPDVTENGSNPDEAVFSAKVLMPGHVYIMSNASSGNSILIYKENSDGTLEYQSEVSTGGQGLSDGLGSQGSLILNESHTWMFAVNAGDNTISSLMVAADGSLNLVSTVSSNGIRPVSLSVHSNMLYVVNDSTSDVSGFDVAGDGSLSLIPGSYRHLSADFTDPAQISFNTMGDYIYVTEKATNMIAVLSMDAAEETMFINSAGKEPFGFAVARDAFLIVTNAANGIAHKSSVTGYSGAESGDIFSAYEPVENHQTAACWIALTKTDRFAFITNNGSNSISSYYISRTGEPVLLSVLEANTGAAPIDIAVDANNYYVYNINADDHTMNCFQREPLGGLMPLATVSGLPEYAAGMVAN